MKLVVGFFTIAVLMFFIAAAKAAPSGTPVPGVPAVPMAMPTPKKSKPYNYQKPAAPKPPVYPALNQGQLDALKVWLDKKVKAGKMTQAQEDAALKHPEAVFSAVQTEQAAKPTKGAK